MSSYSDQPWLPSYQPGMPATLTYPTIPLHALLTQSAANFPDRPAIIYQDAEHSPRYTTLTYRQLDELSSRFAAALVARGIRKGDRVACYMQNCPELVTAFYGVLKAGAVPAPCNPMYQQDELSDQLADSQPSLLLSDAERHPLARKVASAGLASDVLVVEDEDFERALADQPLLPKAVQLDPATDLALLPYTGGTTGVSKGAMLTHRNMVVNALQFSTWYRYQPGQEVFISTLPLFHIGGIAGAMTVPISVGGTMLLFRRFDAARVLKAIQDYRATRFPGVPTMYIAALNLGSAHQYDLSSLQACRTSAASLPPTVKHAFDDLVGHEVLVEGYGLTETAPLTHANPVHNARAGSIGLPLPDTDARIVDAAGGISEVPVGEVGELVLRGPQVMAGYWKKPAETAEAIRDGWFYTGDLARMDEDGYFYIVDRKKDVINAAGFKVWPREVEEVLLDHPQVKMAAVIGMADDYRGETVKAVLVLKDGVGNPSEEHLRQELSTMCRERLAAFKVPRTFEFRDYLPLSAAGKVLKRELRS